ncbi:hypothetical protein HJFPF1_04551 [Paramyrothecium foliicola]|nr:hypothetical protein HJFPF1_04551 [Paramyrothecium foliicola]
MGLMRRDRAQRQAPDDWHIAILSMSASGFGTAVAALRSRFAVCPSGHGFMRCPVSTSQLPPSYGDAPDLATARALVSSVVPLRETRRDALE